MSNVVEMGKKYNLYSWSAQSKINPINIVKTEGIYFWDGDGKKYYDMSAQLVNMNLGHGNKKLIQAIKDQAEKIIMAEPRTIQLLPGSLLLLRCPYGSRTEDCRSFRSRRS